ncbi:MAG: isochorismate synthase [Myxococcota bacterium]
MDPANVQTISTASEPTSVGSDLESLTLGEAVVRTLSHARTIGKPALLVKRERLETALDPLQMVLSSDARREPMMVWQTPEGDTQLALGALSVLSAEGPGRFEALARGCTAVASQLPDPSMARWVRWYGGFAFLDRVVSPQWSAFGAGRFVLPEATLAAHSGGPTTFQWAMWIEPEGHPKAYVRRALERSLYWSERLRRARKATWAERRTTPMAPRRDDPSHADSQAWMKAVDEAAAEIRAPDSPLKKVVLARQVEVVSASLDVAALLKTLRESQPGCHTFMVSERGTASPEASKASNGAEGRVFLGATPELLVRKRGRELQADALAGSAPITAPPEVLLDSPKERIEHALVVETIEQALAPLCSELDVPLTPELLRLATIHHLRTPIRGRLDKPLSVLELAARLHPTPAVCGLPAADARALIHQVETGQGFDRGWYAGGVGWVDAQGDGSIVVALRSALVEHHRAHLFAGAGIVGDSQPEAEFAETGLKLQAIARALAGQSGGSS